MGWLLLLQLQLKLLPFGMNSLPLYDCCSTIGLTFKAACFAPELHPSPYFPHIGPGLVLLLA